MHITCAAKCAKELNEIAKNGLLVLDTDGVVFDEYKRYLSFSGQPGAGDVFFKWLADHRYNAEYVRQVVLERDQAREYEYSQYPDSAELRGFDRSDRVFVALARAHPDHPSILTALDSDYWHFRGPLENSGVDVIHVCGTAHYKSR